MMASLYHSSSPASPVSALMSLTTFMVLQQTTEEEGGILVRLDAKPHAAPFDDVLLAGDQVFDRAYALAAAGRPDLDVAEVEPELPRAAAIEGDGDRHRVIAGGGFLHEAGDVIVVHLCEAQIAGLLQRCTALPQPIEMADIVLDVAFFVPVPRLQLVFLRVQILFLARDRLVLEQLEAIIDAVIARERRSERDACLKDPGIARLQVEGQNVRCIDEEIRPEIFAFGIPGDLPQIRFQLVLAGAPGEVGIRLREAELGESLHHLRTGKRLGEENHAGIDRLHFTDQPFPELEWLGMRIVDAENPHALLQPEQHDIAQGGP